MFLPIGLPHQPNTVIYEKVMNSKDISCRFLFCVMAGESIQAGVRQWTITSAGRGWFGSSFQG